MRAFERAWWYHQVREWAQWIHVVAAAVIVGALIVEGPFETHDVKVLIAYIAVLVYVLVLMLFLGYFIHSYSRKARYAESMYCVHKAVHQAKDTIAYLQECKEKPAMYDSARFEEMLRAVLGSLVDTFNIVTSVRNRACIKVLAGEGDEKHVRTLCRDPGSHERHHESDSGEGRRHLISKNTDFRVLLDSEKRYFLSHDLQAYPDYRTTSLSLGAQQTANDLTYRTAMVLPIRLTSSGQPTSKPLVDVLGFLAVDANATHVYSERYDVEVTATVADALFALLDLWSEVDSESQNARN